MMDNTIIHSDLEANNNAGMIIGIIFGGIALIGIGIFLIKKGYDMYTVKYKKRKEGDINNGEDKELVEIVINNNEGDGNKDKNTNVTINENGIQENNVEEETIDPILLILEANQEMIDNDIEELKRDYARTAEESKRIEEELEEIAAHQQSTAEAQQKREERLNALETNSSILLITANYYTKQAKDAVEKDRKDQETIDELRTIRDGQQEWINVIVKNNNSKRRGGVSSDEFELSGSGKNGCVIFN